MRTNEQRVKSKGQGAAQGSGVRGQGSGYSTRIAVFLITLSGLILEVGLTRIYSASIWYHFAFVAISVALLGWGLGGFTVHLLKQRVRLLIENRLDIPPEQIWSELHRIRQEIADHD